MLDKVPDARKGQGATFANVRLNASVDSAVSNQALSMAESFSANLKQKQKVKPIHRSRYYNTCIANEGLLLRMTPLVNFQLPFRQETVRTETANKPLLSEFCVKNRDSQISQTKKSNVIRRHG